MISISEGEHLPSFWKRDPGGTRKWPIGLLQKEQIKSNFYNYISFLDEK